MSEKFDVTFCFVLFFFVENEENFEIAVARQEEASKEKITVIFIVSRKI